MHVLVLVLASAGHSAEHFDDANQESLAVGKCSCGRLVQEASDVEDGSALHGGTTSDGVIPAPLGSVGFGRTFGNVERIDMAARLSWSASDAYPRGTRSATAKASASEFNAALVDVETSVVQHAPPIGPPGASVSVHEHEHVHEYEDVHEYKYEARQAAPLSQQAGCTPRDHTAGAWKSFRQNFPDGHTWNYTPAR